MEALDIIQKAFEELRAIPPEYHLCCPKVSDEDDEDYDDLESPGDVGVEKKRQRIQDGRDRQDTLYNCALILGLQQESQGAFLTEFSERAGAVLGNCSNCIRNWHRGRKPFLKRLSQFYDDTVVSEMEDRINGFDFERITKGLLGAQEFIHQQTGVVDQRVFLEADRADLLVAIFEALCCMPYLSLPDNRRYFNFVFERIQERKVLKLPDVLPTMTYFLFEEDAIRQRFAVYTWSRQSHITAEDFEWAVKDNLKFAISRVFDPSACSPAQLQLFWQGFSHILNALDEDLILHSLQALGVQPGVYDLLLSHMMVNSDQLLMQLIKVLCTFLEKSPKAFWAAYSQYTHISVAEQVFRSPAFKVLLRRSGELAMLDGVSATSWIKAFVDSVPTHSRGDVCDALVHHLLDDFAKDPSITPAGIQDCQRAAADALASTLGAFASPSYKLHAGSSTIQTNATLNLVLKHKDMVLRLARLPPKDARHISLARSALSVIEFALALDSRITVEECNALQLSDSHVQREVKRNSSGLWDAFLENLSEGENGASELSKAMLSATYPLLSVEIFRPRKKTTLSPVKTEFNVEYQKTAASIGNLFTRLSGFEPSLLQHLFTELKTIQPIIAALIHGEEDISAAATEFIKTVTNEIRREDAVQHLLTDWFVPTLASFTKAIDQVNEKKTLWSSQLPIIRYSRDFLDSMCDASGVLRSKTLTSGECQILNQWWTSQWVCLENAFEQTEAWSHLIEMETMKEFCRLAMEHADALLSQDGVLASALSQQSVLNSSVSGAEDPGRTMRNILEQPRMHCDGLSKMLRLKDLYLVTVIVSVMGKLLKRLKEFNMQLPGKTLSFIRQTIKKLPSGKYNVATNMNDRQRAEIQKALGEDPADDDDDIQIVSIRKAETMKQTRLDTWSKSGDGVPSTIKKPEPRSNKDDVRELLRASSSDKNRATLERMKARQPMKPVKPSPQATAANLASIKEQRAKEKEEKRKRDAEIIARAKALRAPKSIVSGEGSGMQGLAGVLGKDHAPQKSEIMVNSSSEDEDDSEEDAAYEAQISGQQPTARTSIVKKAPTGPIKKMKIQRSAKDMRARLVPPMDELHRAILEWDIFHEGNDPPNGILCSHVSDSYDEPSSHRETFFPLLINEAWRSFVTAKDECTAQAIGVKIVTRMTVDSFIEVSTSMPKTEKRSNELGEGDLVLLSVSAKALESPEAHHCLARIWRTQYKAGSKEISYRISSKAGPILTALAPQAEVYVVKITNMTTIEREYASLKSLQYFDLMPEILEAKPSPMLTFDEEAVAQTMKNYHLNPGQAKAILNAKANDAFTLVQGPPGTGKTKTIIAMVGALLTGTFSTNTGVAIKRPTGANAAPNAAPPMAKKLLVCAPSNAAVDELVLRLKQGVKTTKGTFHKINVVRLGRSEAVNSLVQDVTLDKLVQARAEGSENESSVLKSREAMHKEAGEIKEELMGLRGQLETAREMDDREAVNRLQRSFDEVKRRQQAIGKKIDADKDSGMTVARENELRRRKFQQEILDGAHVLCTTLSGAGHEMFKNLNVEFETVIIDEAAQCVELSALIPLKYGCTKCILVGDPKQLPPTVLSQSAAQYGYDQSLFVRMQRRSPKDIHLLDTQYRMHPEISKFPSQEFYERKLVDGDGLGALRVQPWHSSALLGPYRFFDVKGSQERGARGQSLVNTEELKVAMKLYQRIRQDYPEVDLKGKIGIITPYKAQLFRLRDQFVEHYGEKIQEHIEFNTTDAFQGRECEIIIFSCVRASPTGGIGFMTDIRRMNVGLTRAKSSLWVLGDSRALSQGRYWRQLIEDAQQRERYTEGNILQLLSQPGQKVSPTSWITSRSNSPKPETKYDQEKNGNYETKISPRMEDIPMREATSKTAPQIHHIKSATHSPQSHSSHDSPSMDAPRGPPPTKGYGGLNERGESSIVPRTSDRPIIHASSGKRHRDNSADGREPKRPTAPRGLLPGKRAPPSAPRAMPRPQDPSAMSVLGIKDDPVKSSRNPPAGPAHASNGPPAPNGGIIPPRRKPPPASSSSSSNMFIQRKPNKPPR
ncbi:SEN1 N terminal-domain-containing protein [Microdochium trichocladiopsis]|uniref:SEN1 N terminal-domain-containing protein n=1 Tax=Microdochium trichocladiopsis TaxID=1682393 RepID=A0A9P9BUE1_9PEZI|nr:SEN1 N terminal-domain-containing protein [Microdochium trichocladiopsis]KAH7037379.1 SEN1 N terminal-domain-containing protein [Microdochium trichocladiopsis]